MDELIDCIVRVPLSEGLVTICSSTSSKSSTFTSNSVDLGGRGHGRCGGRGDCGNHPQSSYISGSDILMTSAPLHGFREKSACVSQSPSSATMFNWRVLGRKN